MEAPALTPEELQHYASLDLADPDDEALQAFLSHAGSSPAALASAPTTPAAAAGAHSPASSSSSSSTSVTDAALRRRPSMSMLTAHAAARAAAMDSAGTPLHRGGVTDVLAKSDLVGGIAGMADATLQTRIVELPARQLRSVASVECFLNATHVYLQHNTIASLDGLELLSQLQVLVVHHNALTSLAPLQGLERLFYLDASANQLASPLQVLLDDELPCSALRYLNLKDNPCSVSPSSLSADGGSDYKTYRQRMCDACVHLEYLDDERVGDVTSASSGDDDAAEELMDVVSAENGEKAGGMTAATVHSARASAQSAAPATATSSRRVQSLVAATRMAAAQPAPRTRSDGDGAPRPATSPPQLTEGAGDVPVRHGSRSSTERAASASLSAAAKAAGPLEQEEERLVRQLLLLRHNHNSSPEATAREVHSAGASSPAAAAEGNEGDAKQESDTLSTATAMDAMQVFQGLRYTQEVAQARQQREIAAHWDDVSRVLQTAQGLQLDRRRRIRERLNSATASYTETLQLLQKESYSNDLDRYRSTNGPPPVPTAAASSEMKKTDERKEDKAEEEEEGKERAAASTAAPQKAPNAKDSTGAKAKAVGGSVGSTKRAAAASSAAAPAAAGRRSSSVKKSTAGPKLVPKPPPPRR